MRRLVLLAPMAALLLLSGCGSAPTTGSGYGNTANSGSMAEATQANTLPGTLSLRLKNASSGSYYGWTMEVSKAESNQGFVPFTTPQMQNGQNQGYPLWPDRYWVTVKHLDETRYSGWVDVQAGQLTELYVDIGWLSDDIEVHGPMTAANQPPVTQPIDSSYKAFTLPSQSGYDITYQGPQDHGLRTGRATFIFKKDDQTVLTLRNALWLAGTGPRGTMDFEDGRTVTGQLDNKLQLTEGSITHWPDGSQFVGTYDGLTPAEGTFTFKNNDKWRGKLRDGVPYGSGRITWHSGQWMEVSDASTIPSMTGRLPCTSADGTVTTCMMFDGKLIDSETEYLRLQDERALMNQVAMESEGMPPVGDSSNPGGSPEESTTSLIGDTSASQNGEINCTRAVGKFVKDGGLSTLTLTDPGAGSGTLVQLDGSGQYRFEVGFSFKATADTISFKYQPAHYKLVSSGEVMQTTTMPDASASCQYNGQSLVINGETYHQ
ncbi:hypothetical protein ACKC9G_15725 [Pokkaliibacter sp. CJK22405]|uniref:hypothetical protein n=1 Tax=Pokkaliibacter sp. CJK22405 TaxID=3384615 RepID=UPI00398508E4